MRTPRLVTKRLILEKLRPQNSQKMYSYPSHPEISRNQFWKPGSEEEVKQFIQKMDKTGFCSNSTTANPSLKSQLESRNFRPLRGGARLGIGHCRCTNDYKQ